MTPDKFREWQDQHFGFWEFNLGRQPEGRDIEAWVDHTWAADDKEKLLGYLDSAPLALPSLGIETCLICGQSTDGGQSVSSDDIFIWPSQLAHYVRSHQVRLPDNLVEHIRAREYTPPTDLNHEYEEILSRTGLAS